MYVVLCQCSLKGISKRLNIDMNERWQIYFLTAWWLSSSSISSSSCGLPGTQQISNTSWEISAVTVRCELGDFHLHRWLKSSETVGVWVQFSNRGFSSFNTLLPPSASLLSSNKTLKLFHTSQSKETPPNSNQVSGALFVLHFCVLEFAHLNILPIIVVFLNIHPAIHAQPMNGKHVILVMMCYQQKLLRMKSCF